MRTDFDLNTLRQKAYLQYQGDGLLDIVIGLAVIGFGLSMIASGFLVMSWLPSLSYVPLKRLVTIPRFGYVEFDSAMENRKKLARTLLLGVLSLSLFSGLFFWLSANNIPASIDSFVEKYILLLLGFFMAIMLLGGGYLLGIKRFTVYAGMTMIILWAGIEMGLQDHSYVVFLGLTFLVPGLFMLGRFLQKYPKDNQNA